MRKKSLPAGQSRNNMNINNRIKRKKPWKSMEPPKKIMYKKLKKQDRQSTEVVEFEEEEGEMKGLYSTL